MKLVTLCQKYGFIDKNYELVRGLIDDKDCFDKLEKTKKGIIFATRWSIESLDYPFIKCIVPMNNFSSPIDADQTIGRGQRPFNSEILYVYIPVSPIDKNNTLLEVAHNKIMNMNTFVSGNHEIKSVNLTNVMGSKQNAKIKVNHQPDPSTPPNYSVLMSDLVNSIGTEKFGEVMSSWRAKRYTDEEIIKDAKKYNTPYEWGQNNESMYYHTYHRGGEIWELATKHMTKRTQIDVDERIVEVLNAIDKCKGKVWALKTFNKKYPKLQNWLKNNPKQPQPKIWNCKVVDMSILPFTGGKFGHLTKELILEKKHISKNLTDWANKIGISCQAFKGLCLKHNIEFEDMIIPIEIRAKENGSKSKMIRNNKGQFLTAVKKKK
jgi:hypothetical protein